MEYQVELKLNNSLQDYLPSQDLLIKAKNVLDNQTNKLSQAAIQSLGSDTSTFCSCKNNC
jgi:hypothetical protein